LSCPPGSGIPRPIRANTPHLQGPPGTPALHDAPAGGAGGGGAGSWTGGTEEAGTCGHAASVVAPRDVSSPHPRRLVAVRPHMSSHTGVVEVIVGVPVPRTPPWPWPCYPVWHGEKVVSVQLQPLLGCWS
jgi:hypothetical protein